MWPRRTFVRKYRLRLVTFEPAKAVPVSVCAGEGFDWSYPAYKGPEESPVGIQIQY